MLLLGLTQTDRMLLYKDQSRYLLHSRDLINCKSLMEQQFSDATLQEQADLLGNTDIFCNIRGNFALIDLNFYETLGFLSASAIVERRYVL